MTMTVPQKEGTKYSASSKLQIKDMGQERRKISHVGRIMIQLANYYLLLVYIIRT